MTQQQHIALIAVTHQGIKQARHLRTRLQTGELYRPDRYGPSTHPWDHPYQGALSEQIPALFQQCDQLVFFLATGAVTRLIAPWLSSKTTDPGVLAVDEAGAFVVPVLSGHQGGANAFARTVAGCLGAIPVITTASDIGGRFSPDLLADTLGWIAEPSERLKAAALALVNRTPVALIQEIGCQGEWLAEKDLPDQVTVLQDCSQLTQTSFAYVLWVTDRVVTDCCGIDPERILWYRPKSLVLGVGCERGIPVEALEEGLEQFLQRHCYAKASIGALATLDRKADETGILKLAERYNWPLVFYSAAELAQVSTMANPSPVVEQCVGTPGVAEPAALLTASAPHLLVEKEVISSKLAPQRMTFALARYAAYNPVSSTRGKVFFIGAGPGDPDLLTIKARHCLERADVVIYAGSLIPEDILRFVRPGAVLHNSAYLALEELMEIMLSAVQAGKKVARLQSGDLSLYSAIQEQMTLLDTAGIDYELIPGISAFQAAAAALKSEFTLPQEVQTIILTRGEGRTSMPERESLASLAAHQATLCIFLSARLSKQVQEQLLTAYPPDTPVAILYRVSWPDEKIMITELAHLHSEIRKHRLTRSTLIVVGTAIRGRKNRSQLYDKAHGHIFRRRRHVQKDSPA